MSKKFDHNYCLRPARQPGSFAKIVCFALPHLAHHSKAKSLAFSFRPLYAPPSKELNFWLVVRLNEAQRVCV